MNDLVSILIPANNAEKWIADTIKSALNQACPRKEIIVVDDGSTDNTLQIAREFESKSVKVITQENMGACVARNKALEFAQGDYIQWLDADDLLSPIKISQQLKGSESGQYSRTLLTSAFGVFYYRYQKARFIPNSLWQDLEPIEWILKKFNDNVWMNPAVWLVSRRLTELAGPWNEDLVRNQDGEYICRVVSVSDKVKFIPEAKSYYRIGNLGSLSRSTSDKVSKSLFLSLNLCINQILEKENSPRVRKACLKLLQNKYYYFYPEKREMIKEIEKIAKSLNGKLNPPQLNKKYTVIKKIIGWKNVKKIVKIVSNMMIIYRRNKEKIF